MQKSLIQLESVCGSKNNIRSASNKTFGKSHAKGKRNSNNITVHFLFLLKHLHLKNLYNYQMFTEAATGGVL